MTLRELYIKLKELDIHFIFNDQEKSAYLYIGKHNDVCTLVEELLGNE